MQVTFTVDGDIYERDGVDDIECREVNGEWCLKIDERVEYVGEEPPEYRVQSES